MTQKETVNNYVTNNPATYNTDKYVYMWEKGIEW